MQASLPRRRAECLAVPIQSSNKKDSYPVTVNGTVVTCPCRGFRYHQAMCRHYKGVRWWLEAIIPPREFPS